MGNKSKDANRERLEIMKNIIVLTTLGIFSLLMANETRYSALSMLENPEKYKGMWIGDYNQYALLSSGFFVCGILCIVVAVGLFVFIENQNQNQAR